MPSTIHDFKVKNAQGQETDLNQYKGKAVLIVNVASKCGFTVQYEGLEKLYEQYHERGLTVLGFPCNQFGGQEPGNNEDIQQFCKLNYGVSFPVMAKIDVNGKNADPLYEFLKESSPGILGTEAIKWNFTKFLVGKNGKVIQRYAPQVKPEDLNKDIEKVLS
jgi:glutathione peroxidase